MTDSELITAYIQDQQRRGLLPNTIAMTTRQLRKFSAECGPFESVTHQAIDLWLDGRKTRYGTPVSSKTRSSWLTSLSAFYTWARRVDLMTVNPVEKIIRPRLHGHGPRPIDAGQLQRAIDAASGDLKLWLLIEAYEGLRCQEVTFLAREDFNLAASPPLLLVRMGKGGKERTLPLHPSVQSAIAEADWLPSHGRLFPKATPPAVSQRINRHLHKLGITSTAHTLRHFFGTRTYIISKDLRQTQEMMGHSSPQTTAGYAAFDQSKAAEIVSQMDIVSIAAGNGVTAVDTSTQLAQILELLKQSTAS